MELQQQVLARIGQRLAPQGGQETDAVERRIRHAQHVQQRREDVHIVDEFVAGLPRCELSGPGDDQRDAVGLLVHQALVGQAPVAARHVAVVGGEDDHGVVSQPELIEAVEDPPDLGVDHCGEVVVEPDHLAPVLPAFAVRAEEALPHAPDEGGFARQIVVEALPGLDRVAVVHAREVPPGQVRAVRTPELAGQEERFIACGVSLHHVDGPLGEVVRRRRLRGPVPHAGHQHLLLRVDEDAVAEFVGQALRLQVLDELRLGRQVAVPRHVHPLEPVVDRSLLRPNVPLAHVPAAVARLLEARVQQHARLRQLGRHGVVHVAVRPHAVREGKQTREHRRPRRRAQAARRVGPRKVHPRRRDAVEVRRLADRVPVAARRVEPELVDADPEDVRPACVTRHALILSVRPAGLAFRASRCNSIPCSSVCFIRSLEPD